MRGTLSAVLGREGNGRGRPGRWSGVAGHGGGRRWQEVGEDADGWVPLVGECVREGEGEGGWAGGR
jgi:hypothetical protein